MDKECKKNLLETALQKAQNGVPVFPCNENKEPIVKGGFKAATTDTDIIEMWFSRNGGFPCLGMPTGAITKRFVIDADEGIEEKTGRKKEGLKSLAVLEKLYGPLPNTLTFKTGGGGYQYVFRLPPGVDIRNSASVLGKDLDVRGNGGYVVIPPSKSYKGPYTVENDAEIADPPEWLITLLTDDLYKEKSDLRANPDPDDDFVIPEGTRDDTIFRKARSLTKQGYPRDAIKDLLNNINGNHCNPPLGTYTNDRSVDEIVDHAFDDYERGEFRVSEKAQTSENESSERDIHNSIDLVDYYLNGFEPTVHLIRGILLKGNSHLFFGPRSCGKSWIALWLASLALKRGLKVLWVDYETNQQTMVERLFDVLRIDPESIRGRIRYHANPDYRNNEKSREEFNRVINEFAPDLIIWDALGGALSAGNLKESEADDIVKWASLYLKYATVNKGITVAIIDHTGHDEQGRPRNSSRKEQEVDVSWQVLIPKGKEFDKRTTGKVHLKRSKDRKSELPKIVDFKIGGTPFVCDIESSLDDIDDLLNGNARKLRRYIGDHPGCGWADLKNALMRVTEHGLKPGADTSVHDALKELSEYELVRKDNKKRYFLTDSPKSKNALFMSQNFSDFGENDPQKDTTEVEDFEDFGGVGSPQGPTEVQSEFHDSNCEDEYAIDWDSLVSTLENDAEEEKWK